MGDSAGTPLDRTGTLPPPGEEPQGRAGPEGRPGGRGSWAVDYEEVE
jgi:hypothetical protein